MVRYLFLKFWAGIFGGIAQACLDTAVALAIIAQRRASKLDKDHFGDTPPPAPTEAQSLASGLN